MLLGINSPDLKAVVLRKYGSPEDLELVDIDCPKPLPGEVLVKVHSTAINSWDWDKIVGKSIFIRMFSPFKPQHKIIGCDISGVVESVGEGVSRFKPGDEVFGDLSGGHWGGFAEYVCASENALTLKSSDMTHEESAASCQAAVLALQAFQSAGGIHKDMRVLINGAGGGVGTFGIQIAKSFGAEVTGVDRTDKLKLMQSLGADHVIDYTREAYTKNGKTYDLIVDNVATGSVKDYKNSLKPDGVFSMIGGSPSTLVSALIRGKRIFKRTGKKISVLGHQPLAKDLETLIQYHKDGRFKPVIDSVYTLESIQSAFEYFGKGNVRGKIIINP